MRMPKRNHHTERRLKPKKALRLAKGTPLSVRMRLGKPYSLNTFVRFAFVHWQIEALGHRSTACNRQRNNEGEEARHGG